MTLRRSLGTAAFGVVLASCGDDTDGVGAQGGGGATAVSSSASADASATTSVATTGAAGAGGAGGAGGEGGAAGCPVGEPCAGGICTGGDVCCPVVQACGTICCATGDACLAGRCQPIPVNFDVALKYAWGGEVDPPTSSDVVITPIVISLDADPEPEIAVSTFSNGEYELAGTLQVLEVDAGQLVEVWSALDVDPAKQLAAGDIDGFAGSELVACTFDGRVRAYDGPSGQEIWTSDPAVCFMPSIADLDADGDVEVVVEGGILDGVSGALESGFEAPLAGSFVVSDVTGDGSPDVVTGSQVFDAGGALVVDIGTANQTAFDGTSNLKSPWPAVADLDLDAEPEIIVVDNLAHEILVWRVEPAAPGGYAIVRPPVDLFTGLDPTDCPDTSWGFSYGGGPPTVADVSGDGVPDVATAVGVGYVVFDGAALADDQVPAAATVLWLVQTVDCTSASTGSAIFDFDGDGVPEVVYSDQQRLRIFDGPTGAVLYETCNTTSTLIENPVVADVDGDGEADLVVVANAWASFDPLVTCFDGQNDAQSGVRVFGPAQGSWLGARSIWNEHAYHVTNVGDDGTIPQGEAPNWLDPALNNFRQNLSTP
jgi:hypothetical protein